MTIYLACYLNLGWGLSKGGRAKMVVFLLVFLFVALSTKVDVAWVPSNKSTHTHAPGLEPRS